MPDAQRADRSPRGRGGLTHLDLRELEIRPGRSRHDVEKRGHLRLEHEVRHHASRGRVREHHPVGASEHELPLRVRAGGARDDREVGTRGARREHDVEVVGVGVRGGDEPSRPLEPCTPQVLVARRVALDHQRAVLVRCGERVLMNVEREVRDVRRPKLVGDLPAHTAVAADDEVVAQLLDPPLPPPFRQRPRDDAAGDRLDDNGPRVADDRQAGEDEKDRHDP